jgi:hypothetical protein
MQESYSQKPGYFTRDLDLLLAPSSKNLKKGVPSKIIVYGKARIIEKHLDGDRVYKVSFHHTITNQT